MKRDFFFFSIKTYNDFRSSQKLNMEICRHCREGRHHMCNGKLFPEIQDELIKINRDRVRENKCQCTCQGIIYSPVILPKENQQTED